jgi:ferredoxin--NADP+ reductase
MMDSPYNATVTGKILITPDLMILRLRTDEPRKQFFAGQYTSIGILGSEPRSLNSVIPIDDISDDELICRPYSIASTDKDIQNFEFYISQVKSGQLTPRLFNLTQGSRMWIDTKILGIFKLNDTPANCDIVMIATGTGLAPYISFIRSHLREHKNCKIVIIHGSAYPWDLGYFSELELLNSTFDNFYYFPTLLKADKTWSGLKGYIEDHLFTGKLLSQTGVAIDPLKTHFFLCGNPKMVASVSNILAKSGYTEHTSLKPGSLHIEEY